MEQNGTKFYKNRGLKRFYIAMPILTAVWIILFGFIVFSRSAIISFFVIMIIMGVFSVFRKYAITDKNTIEFHYLFGWRKKLSIPIETISEIMIKSNRLCIDYRKEGISHPVTMVLELSNSDLAEVKQELLKRNPKIEVS